MNRDINNTLAALVPVLRINGEGVKNIEAVQDWYTVGGREYMKEVAEITYDSGYRMYADIDGDSNLTAVYDVIAVIQQIKEPSKAIQRVVRGCYEAADPTDRQPQAFLPCSPAKENAATKHVSVADMDDPNENPGDMIRSHSEKDILEGCIALIDEMVENFREYLDYIDYEPETEEEKGPFTMSYFHIVNRLFLFRSRHSGGTSTRKKCKELGVDSFTDVCFCIWEDENDERT